MVKTIWKREEMETVEALQLFVSGSAVVARIIRDGTFTPRAITGDPQSAASLELKARGIEVVKGESGDKASLVSLQKTFGRERASMIGWSLTHLPFHWLMKTPTGFNLSIPRAWCRGYVYEVASCGSVIVDEMVFWV
ncbi:hypothetical protein C8F04DRAFT_1187018 [Mycena alexandri]|uniref:Uncharacterized protein n=1 Tax=Mycena alexandri TaxID=1745969 RepID=A0AAD6SML0_9AGAR|nr:hypothetical protein C8F04DRAFT_1187018 [Mycena alexandri]